MVCETESGFVTKNWDLLQGLGFRIKGLIVLTEGFWDDDRIDLGWNRGLGYLIEVRHLANVVKQMVSKGDDADTESVIFSYLI
jgi:hypothetical protein